MHKPFDPKDHYWLGEDFVYSSARDAEVPLDDEGYLAFLAQGQLPTPHPGAAELAEILVKLGVKISLNQQLETAFLSMLPAHLGQPYLTSELIVQIGSLKQVVTDYNRLGLYAISKGMIQALDLPVPMRADRDNLVTLYPTE